MNLLITGGLGYIGSHLCVELLKRYNNIVVLDNLSNSRLITKKYIEKISKKKIRFIKNDLSNVVKISKILKQNKIDFVFHLAGLKSVKESFKKSYSYYKNNSFFTLNLLQAMHQSNVNQILFSSSATVYSAKNKNPIKENGNLDTINPYGTSKLISEKLIIDHSKFNNNFSYVILRYFNPIGHHVTGLLNDDFSDDNLVPNLLKKLKNKKPFLIYGKNYRTKDKTAIRDYIHINDLISAHVLSLRKFSKHKNQIFNVGTGNGYSVLNVIKSFEKVLNKKVQIKFTKRRKGDLEKIYCSSSKIKKRLKWKPLYSLIHMCKDSIRNI